MLGRARGGGADGGAGTEEADCTGWAVSSVGLHLPSRRLTPEREQAHISVYHKACSPTASVKRQSLHGTHTLQPSNMSD